MKEREGKDFVEDEKWTPKECPEKTNAELEEMLPMPKFSKKSKKDTKT